MAMGTGRLKGERLLVAFEPRHLLYNVEKRTFTLSLLLLHLSPDLHVYFNCSAIQTGILIIIGERHIRWCDCAFDICALRWSVRYDDLFFVIAIEIFCLLIEKRRVYEGNSHSTLVAIGGGAVSRGVRKTTASTQVGRWHEREREYFLWRTCTSTRTKRKKKHDRDVGFGWERSSWKDQKECTVLIHWLC